MASITVTGIALDALKQRLCAAGFYWDDRASDGMTVITKINGKAAGPLFGSVGPRRLAMQGVLRCQANRSDIVINIHGVLYRWIVFLFGCFFIIGPLVATMAKHESFSRDAWLVMGIGPFIASGGIVAALPWTVSVIREARALKRNIEVAT